MRSFQPLLKEHNNSILFFIYFVNLTQATFREVFFLD